MRGANGNKPGMQMIYETVTGKRIEPAGDGRRCAFCGGPLTKGRVPVGEYCTATFNDAPQFEGKSEPYVCEACRWMGKKVDGRAVLLSYTGGRHCIFSEERGRENFGDIGAMFRRFQKIGLPAIAIASGDPGAMKKYTAIRLNRSVTRSRKRALMTLVGVRLGGDDILDGTVEFDMDEMAEEVGRFIGLIGEYAAPIMRARGMKGTSFNAYMVLKSALAGMAVTQADMLAMHVAAGTAFPPAEAGEPAT